MEQEEGRSYTEQEEFREYKFTEEEFSVVRDYIKDLENSKKLAKEMFGYSNVYYISQQVHDRAIVAILINNKRILQILGDSQALGMMKARLEDKLEISLGKRTLKTRAMRKAFEVVEDDSPLGL